MKAHDEEVYDSYPEMLEAMPFASVLSLLGPLLVGAVLTLAGLTKAIEPQAFVRHLRNLRLLPQGLLGPATLTVAALQCGLGTALLLRLWPAWLLPAAGLALLALAVLGYWGTATGRTADCGCYNGLFTFSPLQSLLLDLGYVSLLALSWWWGVPAAEPGPWRISAVLAAAAGAGALTYSLLRFAERHGRPLIEMSPLKVGRRWKPRWLAGDAGLAAADGAKIVVFLGANCSHCMRWIKVLNAVHQLPNLPEILGVVALPAERLPDYVSRSSAQFPVMTVTPWDAVRLARGVTPTAVVVQDGIIREKWIRVMPQPFIDRIRAEMPRAASPG